MIKRYQWYRLDLNGVSIKQFADKLKDCPYKDEKGDGFLLEQIRPGSLRAKYVNKKVYEEIVLAPDGSEIIYERLAYDTTEFMVSKAIPGIMFINPSRSISHVITKISKLTEYSVAISDIEISVNSWLNILNREFKGINVNSLICSDIEIDKNVTAKIQMKGDRDVRKYLKGYLGGKKSTLDKAIFILEGDTSRKIEIRRKATAVFDDGYERENLKVLNNSFIELM
ncbi:MAG: hypothetical protein QM484_10645 [Woeseiaceae bacterium]